MYNYTQVIILENIISSEKWYYQTKIIFYLNLKKNIIINILIK